MPRLRNETYGTGDQRWLGSTHGMNESRTATLDLSAFTEADHYPDGHILSGTPVDAADEGAVVPWSGSGSLGFVLTDQAVVDDEDIPAPILRHGFINVDYLPGEFSVPADAGSFMFVGAGSTSDGNGGAGGGDNGEEG